MKRILIGIIIIAAVFGFWWFFFQSSDNDVTLNDTNDVQNEVTTAGGVHTITLTNEGYFPEELVISKGDTVRFTTEAGRPFWPASNLHPSHRDYPEFDPKEPILADETWSFTFLQSGEWKFHDHLAPYYSGVIIVSE